MSRAKRLANGNYRTAAGSTVAISGLHGGIASVEFDWFEETNACVDCVAEAYPVRDREVWRLVWNCGVCGGGSAPIWPVPAAAPEDLGGAAPGHSDEVRTKRCALYVRSATTDQSCEMQLRELRAYVERRAWVIAGEYVDTGCSGASSARPQLLKLMEDAKPSRNGYTIKEFECVLVWTLDRWGRSLEGCLEGIHNLSELSTRWMAVNQGIDIGVGSPLLVLIDALRKFGTESKRERIQAGMKVAKRRDLAQGRPKRVFDHEKVLWLFQSGESIRAIAKAMGIGYGTVRRILSEPKGS